MQRFKRLAGWFGHQFGVGGGEVLAGICEDFDGVFWSAGFGRGVLVEVFWWRHCGGGCYGGALVGRVINAKEAGAGLTRERGELILKKYQYFPVVRAINYGWECDTQLKK